MKAFIWHEIKSVSDNYHQEGSVLIIAESIERARQLAFDDGNISGVDSDPDFIFDANNYEEKVVAFPNAGCC